MAHEHSSKLEIEAGASIFTQGNFLGECLPVLRDFKKITSWAVLRNINAVAEFAAKTAHIIFVEHPASEVVNTDEGIAGGRQIEFQDEHARCRVWRYFQAFHVQAVVFSQMDALAAQTAGLLIRKIVHANLCIADIHVGWSALSASHSRLDCLAWSQWKRVALPNNRSLDNFWFGPSFLAALSLSGIAIPFIINMDGLARFQHSDCRGDVLPIQHGIAVDLGNHVPFFQAQFSCSGIWDRGNGHAIIFTVGQLDNAESLSATIALFVLFCFDGFGENNRSRCFFALSIIMDGSLVAGSIFFHD